MTDQQDRCIALTLADNLRPGDTVRLPHQSGQARGEDAWETAIVQDVQNNGREVSLETDAWPVRYTCKATTYVELVDCIRYARLTCEHCMAQGKVETAVVGSIEMNLEAMIQRFPFGPETAPVLFLDLGDMTFGMACVDHEEAHVPKRLRRSESEQPSFTAQDYCPFMTLDEIRAAEQEHGGHFFESASFGMFNTTWPDEIHPCPYGAFFTTGEHDSDAKDATDLAAERYTVRYANSSGRVSTVGDSRHFSSRRDAEKAAAHLASLPRGAQRDNYIKNCMTARA